MFRSALRGKWDPELSFQCFQEIYLNLEKPRLPSITSILPSEDNLEIELNLSSQSTSDSREGCSPIRESSTSEMLRGWDLSFPAPLENESWRRLKGSGSDEHDMEKSQKLKLSFPFLTRPDLTWTACRHQLSTGGQCASDKASEKVHPPRLPLYQSPFCVVRLSLSDKAANLKLMATKSTSSGTI